MSLTRRFDTIIVGGGPAGLAAAVELGQSGASVALIEEHDDLGGQYFKRRRTALKNRYGDYRPQGTRLVERAHSSRTVIATSTVVWGCQAGVLHTVDATGRPGAWSARRYLLATGGYERALPFPGWTLPGVTTAGFALHLASMDLTPIGQSVVIAGSGPFLLVAAVAVLRAGGKVAAVVEERNPYRLSAAALRTAAFPSKAAELARYWTTIKRHRVPLLQGWRVRAATGDASVESVELVQLSSGRRHILEADALCVGYGFRPNSELAQLMGCACDVNRSTYDSYARTDGDGRTSQRHVFVAGESAGIAGMRPAQRMGRLAAWAIATDLGFPKPNRIVIDRERRLLARDARFAKITADAFPPCNEIAHIPDNTIVCRCEVVTAGTIRNSIADGSRDLNAMKSHTRAGMGLCQGRECGAALSLLVSPHPNLDTSAIVYTPRMPIRPIQIPTYAEEPKRP